MTVSGTSVRTDTTGDGIARVFSFSWRCDVASWVTVYLGGVLQSSGYTVALNTNQDTTPGGTVTFTLAPGDGVAVALVRQVPLTQARGFSPYSPFPANEIEKALDQATLQAQELSASIATLEADMADVPAQVASLTAAAVPPLVAAQVPGEVAAEVATSVPPLIAAAFDPMTAVDTVPLIGQDTIPDAPSAGRALLYSGTDLSRPHLRWRLSNGSLRKAQPAFERHKNVRVVQAIGSTSPMVDGLMAYTAMGTAIMQVLAATNFYSRMRRLAYWGAAPAGSHAGFYYSSTNALYLFLGDGTPGSGFFASIRFGIPDDIATSRLFIGLRAAISAPTNVEPSTLTNVIGVGNGASDTELSIFYGGSAAQTPIGLGANFPARTSAADVYELNLYSPGNASDVIHYQVERLNTGHVAAGTLTAATGGVELPSNTQGLAPITWRCNNATAAMFTLNVMHVYTETDY